METPAGRRRPAPALLLAIPLVAVLLAAPGVPMSHLSRATETPAAELQIRGHSWPASSGSHPISPAEEAAIPAVGGQGRLIVNTTDPSIAPNWGLRTNITDYFALPFAASSAFQVSAAETIGADVAVFGIFQNDQVYPVPFFSVFSNSTDATLHLAYWGNLTLVGGESYDFALVRTSGTNWTLTMNGELFADNASAATFDFGAAVATWGAGVSFSEVAFYAGSLTTPSLLEVPVALATMRPGGWYLPQSARSYLVTNQAGWGAQGRAQNSSLAPGELVTGASIVPSPNGTTLWTGGPVAVNVNLELASSVTRGTTIVPAAATVYSVAGQPLGGVPLAFTDSIGSTFSPSSGLSDPTGFVSTYVGTPNVTARVSDTVRVASTLLGYVGNASVGLTLTPPTQLFLNLSPSAPIAITGGSITMTVAAVDQNGTPGAGVLLLTSVLAGPAKVTPFATTDVRGEATIVFSAPPTPSIVPLAVLVVAPGYWGHTNVNVTVRSPPPSLLTLLQPYLIGAAVALAAVGLVLVIRSRRRRRPRVPIPKLGLPGDEDSSSAPTLSGASRRPP